MSIASRITAMQEHIEDDYEVLETAGADLTNVDKNIINLKQTWKERLLYFINNGVEDVWNNWEKVTGTGSLMTLNNTAEAPMSLTYNGNTIQDGTPTPDTPKEVQTVTGRQEIDIIGKNLYDKNTMLLTQGLWSNSGKISNNSNGWYVIVPIIGGETYRLSKKNRGVIYTCTTETYPSNDVSIVDTWGGGNNLNGRTITTSNSANYLFIGLGASASYTDEQKASILEELQIEINNESTSYEEYKRQIYEINLGKNLFDKDNANILTGTWIDGSKLVADVNTKTLYISIEGGKKYTVSKILSARFRIGTTSSLPALNVSTIDNSGSINSETTYTINTSSTAKYLCVYYYSSSADTLTEQEILDSIQIETGSQATSYSAYKTPIELCKIGDYKDRIYQDSGTWYIYKAVGKSTVNVNNINTSYSNLDYAIINKPSNSIHNGNYSDIFFYTEMAVYKNITSSKVNDASNVNYIASTFSSSNYYLGLEKNTYTLETIQNAINGKYMYYPLATPTTTEITDSDLISQLEEIKKSYNNITNINVDGILPTQLDVVALKM